MRSRSSRPAGGLGAGRWCSGNAPVVAVSGIFSPRASPVPGVSVRALAPRPAVLVGADLALLGTPAVLGAQSQAATGIIRGVVADPSGNPVANAQVVLHETQTNFTRTLTTDAAGNFAGTLLPLGTYDATARAGGFAEGKQTGVALGGGETVAPRLPRAAGPPPPGPRPGPRPPGEAAP